MRVTERWKSQKRFRDHFRSCRRLNDLICHLLKFLYLEVLDLENAISMPERSQQVTRTRTRCSQASREQRVLELLRGKVSVLSCAFLSFLLFQLSREAVSYYYHCVALPVTDDIEMVPIFTNKRVKTEMDVDHDQDDGSFDDSILDNLNPM